MSLQIFRRHPSPDGELPEDQRALGALERVLSELLEHLDMQVSGENGEALLFLVEIFKKDKNCILRLIFTHTQTHTHHVLMSLNEPGYEH